MPATYKGIQIRHFLNADDKADHWCGLLPVELEEHQIIDLMEEAIERVTQDNCLDKDDFRQALIDLDNEGIIDFEMAWGKLEGM